MSLPSTAYTPSSHAEIDQLWSTGRLADSLNPSSPPPPPSQPTSNHLHDRFTPNSGMSSLAGSPSTLSGRRSSRPVQPMGAVHGNADPTLSPRPYGPNGTSPSAARQAGRSTSERSPSPPPRTMVHGAMAEALNASKSPGLIRRFSRGASQRLRRRTSTQQSLRMRDQSAGPVLMRRRSDSAGASDRAPDISDLELDPSTEDVADERPYVSAINRGIRPTWNNRPSNASSHYEGGFEGGIAPATSAILQNGTWVYKLTPKKQKRLYIWLDPNTARVCWHSTNSSKSFFIDDVREVRVGKESRNMRDEIKIPEEKEHLAVSLVCDMHQRSKGANIKTLHFLMPDEFVLDLWTDALSTVTRERVEIMNALSSSTEKSDRSMAMAWKLRKGPNADQFFTLEDARWMCRMLEINCSDNAVRTHFTMCDEHNMGKLSYAQYKDFINSFKERKDIQNLFRNLKLGTDLDMDADSFMSFLSCEQGIKVEKDRAYWEGVFDRYARAAPKTNATSDADSLIAPARTMSMQGFSNFLTSSYNSPLKPGRAEISFDRPLNEYFISSSHNTYLLGRQVRGESSVEGYIASLIKGCRCVEIDCWDGDDVRPMVTHGRTMTTRVSFEDVMSVIAKYAFHSTPLPLILSLEVHCVPSQQLAMVSLIHQYLDGMVVTEPIHADATTLPSPEELKRRILIKVKAAEEQIEAGSLPVDIPSGRSRARSLGSAMTPNPFTDYHANPIGPMPIPSSLPPTSPSDTTVGSVPTPRGSTTSGPTNTPSTSSDSEDAGMTYEKPKKRKTSKIIPELGRLGVYTSGIRYTGFNAPEAKTFNHIFSFNESTFSKLGTKSSDTKTILERHNQRFLMRVYPAARRLDSSNFDPLQVWRRGVQMAALNWQTYDECQQINAAMFAAGSDHFGYVLKPDELRHSKHIPIADTILESGKKERKGKKLIKFTVDVISAQRLPRPKTSSSSSSQAVGNGMNPYIVFGMYSAEDKSSEVARGEGGADASRHPGTSNGSIGSPLRKRTKIVEGNGFDPIWNESITMTVVTKYPGLIFVRFAVHNSPEARSTASTNSGPLAVFTAKLDSLQQGYRHLPLFNDWGEQYRDAKLFVRIRKEAALPLTMQQDEHNYHHNHPSQRVYASLEQQVAAAGGSVNAPAPPPSVTAPSSIASPTPNSSLPSTAAAAAAAAAPSSSSSPRPEPARSERSWRSRVFSRNPSQRRAPSEQAGPTSAPVGNNNNNSTTPTPTSATTGNGGGGGGATASIHTAYSTTTSGTSGTSSTAASSIIGHDDLSDVVGVMSRANSWERDAR